MKLTGPPNAHEIVRRNWRHTTGFLLAGTHPCLDIRDAELKAIGKNRILVGLSNEDLSSWQPATSWLLGVILCPDDDTRLVALWVKARKADPERVHFYLHPTTPLQALAPWHDAGYPLRRVHQGVDSWARLHKLFGLDLANRVLADGSQTQSPPPVQK